MGHASVRHDGAHLQTILPSKSSELTTPCTHQELLNIDQNSPYTAVSNRIMRHIISNRTIAACSRLWLLIRFEQSGFHDREHVTRTVGWLANALNVSTSTIQKWQRTLADQGYLEIIEQRIDGHHNAPNRYRACLPRAVIESLQAVASKASMPENPRSVTPATQKSGQPSRLAEPPKRIERIEIDQITDLFSSSPSWFHVALPVLEIEVINKQSLWITGVNSLAKQEVLKAKAALIQRLHELGYEIEQVRFNRDQCALSTPSQSTAAPKAPAPLASVTPKPTQALFPHTKHRLLKRISALTINDAPLQPSQAKQLCHEVVYAMQHGSFKGVSTLKAINVAVKLIRENRWRTPYGCSAPS